MGLFGHVVIIPWGGIIFKRKIFFKMTGAVARFPRHDNGPIRAAFELGRSLHHTISVENGGGRIVVTTHGEADAQGILAFLDDIVSHPEWKPGYQILLDHRDLDLKNIPQDGIGQVSQYFVKLKSKLGTGKIALVMNRDIDYGIARAWELMTADDVEISIFVFRTLKEARQWLKA